MTEDRIERAIRAWAAERLGMREDQIKSVEFGTVQGGYCETCEYTTFGADVNTTRGWRQIEESDATEVIREINAKVLNDAEA